MFADPRHPVGQRLEVPQRRLGVGVPEGRELLLGGGRGQPRLVGPELGHRTEQRAVEQLLVQPAHLAAVPAPLLVELRDGLAHEAHRAAQPAQRPVVLGKHVGPAQLPQLHPVLERAQEPVGAVERGAVLPSDVPALGEVGQRGQRGGRPHGLVGATVHQLQQLYGELDVAQAAGAELDLPLGVRGGDVLDHPAAHRLHLGDEAVALRGRPHHRRDAGAELLAQGEVAGDRTGLEQRLELPGLRPLRVVALVAGQRADQRTGLALGPQRGVDRPDRALPGVVRADPHQVRGELRRGAQGRRLVVPLGGLGHEDHVDVADVVELVAAALAHRDHAEPRAVGGRPDPGPGDGQRRVQGAGGEVGQLGGHVVDADAVREVAGGQPEQQPAVGDPQRVDADGVLAGRHRRGGQRVGTHRPQQLGPHRERRGTRGAQRRVGEVVPVLGVPQQVVAERRASPPARRAAACRSPRRRRARRAAAAGPRPGRRGRRGRSTAWSGSAVVAIRCRSSSEASPSRSSAAAECSTSWKPCRASRPVEVVTPLVPHRRTASAPAGSRHTAAKASASSRQVARSRSRAAATSRT